MPGSARRGRHAPASIVGPRNHEIERLIVQRRTPRRGG
jgi:hypothetical protein